MNVRSLSLLKLRPMKTRLMLKFFLVLPLILFFDYLIMALLGCTTCLFGMDDNFYCSPFCITGKIILLLSLLFFLFLLRPEIKTFITHFGRNKNPEQGIM